MKETKSPQQILDQALEDIRNSIFLKQWTAKKGANIELIKHIEWTLDSTLQSFIEAEIARLEGVKKCIFEGDGEKHHCYSCGGIVENCVKCHKDLCNNEKCPKGFKGFNDVYNQAIDDQISHLKELLVTLKR